MKALGTGTLVNGGWLALAIVCLGIMIVFGLLAHALGGHEAAVAVATVGWGAGFYCAAGGAGVLWHKHVANQARKRCQLDGPGSPRVHTLLARALPGRGLTVLQVVVGVVAAIIAVTSL